MNRLQPKTLSVYVQSIVSQSEPWYIVEFQLNDKSGRVLRGGIEQELPPKPLQ